MVVPFLPLFLLQIGVHQHTEIWSGMIYSSSFFAGALSGGIVGPILGGAIAQLVGNRLAFACAGGIAFISTLLIIFFVVEENFTPNEEPGSVRNDLKNCLDEPSINAGSNLNYDYQWVRL